MGVCKGPQGRFAGDDACKAEADAVADVQQFLLPLQHGGQPDGMPEPDTEEFPGQRWMFPPESQAVPELITRKAALPEHAAGTLLQTGHGLVCLVVQR